MIIVKNDFQIKPGKIDEAIEIWKEIVLMMREMDDWQKITLLRNVTGPEDCFSVEIEMKDVLDFGFMMFRRANNPDAADLYLKFLPLCKSSVRVLYHIEI